MTDTFVELPAEPAEGRLTILAAVLLGIAATLTALSAYQAALTDGDALQGYSNSNAALGDANFFYNQGNQTLAQDQQIFIQYATATQESKVELAEYLRTSLMRPELVEAVDWWLEDADAVTPFDEDETNPYVIAEFAEAEAKQKEAEKVYDEGAEADQVGDQFELSTVLFALTLFFGGVATLFRRRSVSLALLVMAAVALGIGSLQLAAAFGA